MPNRGMAKTLCFPDHPEVTLDNYKGNQAFLNKAEDLFVFHHSLNLTRILYVSSVLSDEWQEFLAQNNGRLDKSFYLTSEPQNITAEYLQLLWDFILQHPFEHYRHPPVGGFGSKKSLR